MIHLRHLTMAGIIRKGVKIQRQRKTKDRPISIVCRGALDTRERENERGKKIDRWNSAR